MSEMIHVFARKEDTFIELLWYCRGSSIYEVLNKYAPHGKIAPLSKKQINEVIDKCARSVRMYEDEIAHSQGFLAQIKDWNNLVDEKIVAMDNEERRIAKFADDAEHYKEASIILECLEDISAELYVGIDCGDGVSVQDIVPSIT